MNTLPTKGAEERASAVVDAYADQASATAHDQQSDVSARAPNPLAYPPAAESLFISASIRAITVAARIGVSEFTLEAVHLVAHRPERCDELLGEHRR